MAQGAVVPSLGAASFSCPHCGALAHQAWFAIWAKPYVGAHKPTPSMTGNARTGQSSISRTIISANVTGGATVPMAIGNLNLSNCFSCKNFSVWLADELINPTRKTKVEPHEEMPPNVKADFLEAASIVDLSPRGAAASLRLALQKLMSDLGEKGENINADIASLVSKGLETEIRKALDIVRVIGNNAVHPGELNLQDDRATATALLNLVNIIVDRRIAAKKRIEEMFAGLPPHSLEAIAKRDAKKND